jgi:hypothetical protein
MKNVATLLLFTVCFLLNAQEDVQKSKQNQIEIFYSVSEFFDGSPTNWLFLQRETYGEGTELPVTVGLRYGYILNSSAQIQMSSAFYFRTYFHEAPMPNPQMGKREYLRLSARYLRRVLSMKQANIWLTGGLSYRYGLEFYNSYDSPTSTPSLFGIVSSNDFGLNAGIRVVKPIFGNFHLFLEASYTRYLFINSNSSFNLPGRELPVPHNLTLNYGIGYKF